jgi:hypothetical protein
MTLKGTLDRRAPGAGLRCKRCGSTALLLRPSVAAVCEDCGHLLILVTPKTGSN